MKKVSYFVLGTAFGLALSVGSVAVAANTDLVAKIAGYSIKVNGKQQALTNKPVVINGSTYLPLRETANIVGYSVTLNGTTISLDSKSGTSTSNPTQSTNKGNTTEGKAKVTFVKDLESKYSTNGKLDPDKLKVGLAAGEITVNSQDEDTGLSLLQYVIKEDNYAAYQVINVNALDVNAQDKQGQTALHTVVILGNGFYFSELTSKLYADPTIKDNSGKVARDYAEKNSVHDRALKAYDPNLK